MKKLLCFIGFFLVSSLVAEEAQPQTPPKNQEIKDDLSQTSHTLKINDQTIDYLATAGHYIIKDPQGKPEASIFFVAYTKKNVVDLATRPVTFCFNGGPGSSSVWLHIGAFGPMRLATNEEGFPLLPAHLENNDYSLLDLTDLVFIDPVSTGYSFAIPMDEAKKFYGVEKDIQSVGEFIRLYVTRNDRWLSPKYIAGESYGTTRAAALAYDLFEKDRMSINGIILVSSILNFQAYWQDVGNDLPYILFFPSYTAAAWYHKRIKDPKELRETLLSAETFAMGDYATALLQGDKVDPTEKEMVVETMSQLLGVSKEFILRNNLRIDVFHFMKELLRDQNRVIGRFDARFTGIDTSPASSHAMQDPSFAILFPPFTQVFNHYLRHDLKVESDSQYEVLKDLGSWDYGKAVNQYFDVTEELQKVMSKNPEMTVYVASGLYDLATPYFAGEYVLNHLNLDPEIKKNVQNSFFEAGHMLFIHKPSLRKLKKELTSFYQK